MVIDIDGLGRETRARASGAAAARIRSAKLAARLQFSVLVSGSAFLLALAALQPVRPTAFPRVCWRAAGLLPA